MPDFFIRFYRRSIPSASSLFQKKKYPPGSDLGNFGGFTLVEILVAMGILAMMSVFMLSVVNSAQKIWKQNASRTEEFRGARRAFDRINERLAQATLNDYYDYVDASGSTRTAASLGYSTTTPFIPKSYFRLSDLRYIQLSATSITPLIKNDYQNGSLPSSIRTVMQINYNALKTGTSFRGHAVFFQAPIGSSTSTTNIGMGALMNTVGFYIIKISDLGQIPATIKTTGTRNRYRLYEMIEPTDNLTIYAETSGSAGLYKGTEWITAPIASGTLKNTAGVLSATNLGYSHRLADNIVALLFRADYTDKNGNPTSSGTDSNGNLVSSGTYYSSAPTGTYLYDPVTGLPIQPIEENNLPPSVHVTMVAVDEASGRRIAAGLPGGAVLPDPQYDTSDASKPVSPNDPNGMPYFENFLTKNHLNYIKFESTVKIGSSKWSSQ